MRAYLLDFDLLQFVEGDSPVDNIGMRQVLPEGLLSLLTLPILKDSAGNYLFSTKEHINNINKNIRVEEKDRTYYEYLQNKTNLWDFVSEEEEEKYLKDLELQATTFIRWGLFFSVLLREKLDEITEAKFKVIFIFDIFRTVDSVIYFHAIRENERILSDKFEDEPQVQGIMTLG